MNYQYFAEFVGQGDVLAYEGEVPLPRYDRVEVSAKFAAMLSRDRQDVVIERIELEPEPDAEPAKPKARAKPKANKPKDDEEEVTDASTV